MVFVGDTVAGRTYHAKLFRQAAFQGLWSPALAQGKVGKPDDDR